jgi:endonuclease/exonuclease/phosphatase family metal-dependent hydrolase
MPKFRIATYNIHKGRGLDGGIRIERIGRVLEELNADIVALQEVVSPGGAINRRLLSSHRKSWNANGFLTRRPRSATWQNTPLKTKS